MSRATRRMLLVALALYAVLLVVVLLNPSPAAPSALVAKVAAVGQRLDLPAALVASARIEFALNVLAFVPVSFLGSLLRPSIRVSTWTAAGFAGSFLVEVLQVFLPDRSATHSDVVANTLGAAVGAMAAWLVLAVAAGRQKQARISPTG